MSARATATSPAAAQGGTTGAHHGHGRLTPRAAVLCFSMFVVAVFAIAPARAYLDQHAQLADLQRQQTVLTRQNQELERRIADLNDPLTLERLARECLGMVRPGEIGFAAIPKGRAPVPPDCG